MAKQPYNKLFDAEKYEKVNKYNKELLQDWTQELRAQGKSPKTIYQYERDVKLFYIWVHDYMDNKPLYRLKKKQLRNYILYLRDLELSNARVNRMKSSISSMLTFAEDDEDYEDIEQNYMGKIKGLQKNEVREIVFISDERIELLYNKFKREKRYQELLLLALLYDTGARKNEIHGVKTDYIDLEGHQTTKKVLGKRGKKFILYYHERTIEAYKLYINSRVINSDDLWVNENGVPLPVEWLYTITKKWNDDLEELIGEYMDFNVHSFRHSFADNMYTGTHYACEGEKVPLGVIQVMLHHDSIETTQSYIKPNDDELVASQFNWKK